MGIGFDPVNKYILITSPTTELTALEIYNATMDWSDEQPNLPYDVPMKAVGKFDMGGGVYSDSIFLLINGWKLKFWSETEHFVVKGTLLPESGELRYITPASVEFQVSSQATIIPDVAEWTQTEKDGVISDVGAIKPKTDNLPADPASEGSIIAVKTKTDALPSDPASESTVDTIKTKTENLPPDPASENTVQTVQEELILHDSDIKGNSWDTEASLKEIKEALEELKLYTKVVKKASFDL